MPPASTKAPGGDAGNRLVRPEEGQAGHYDSAVIRLYFCNVGVEIDHAAPFLVVQGIFVNRAETGWRTLEIDLLLEVIAQLYPLLRKVRIHRGPVLDIELVRGQLAVGEGFGVDRVQFLRPNGQPLPATQSRTSKSHGSSGEQLPPQCMVVPPNWRSRVHSGSIFHSSTQLPWLRDCASSSRSRPPLSSSTTL